MKLKKDVFSKLKVLPLLLLVSSNGNFEGFHLGTVKNWFFE